MTTVIDRPKLVAKSLGDPKKVLANDAADARHFVGTIFGVATKVKAKVSTDKAGNPQTFEQIVGEFEGIPATPMKMKETVDGKEIEVEISAIRSGVLYLPAGIHERVAEALKRDDAKPIQFAIELYTVKATNPAGYSWEARSVMDAAEVDPLAEMRKKIEATRQKRLADHSGGKKGKGSEAA